MDIVTGLLIVGYICFVAGTITAHKEAKYHREAAGYWYARWREESFLGQQDDE